MKEWSVVCESPTGHYVHETFDDAVAANRYARDLATETEHSVWVCQAKRYYAVSTEAHAYTVKGELIDKVVSAV